MKIQYQRVHSDHVESIWEWLAQPFIQAFWDNTPQHKEDILNFVSGRIEPSSYAHGKYTYWIACDRGQPFAMLMTIPETIADHGHDIKLKYLSKTGNTYGIDFMIGNIDYFGKGYGAKTLSEFLVFFRREYDSKADTFIIDPAYDNPKAKHVYLKSGFVHVADFVMDGNVSGAGKPHHLLIKRY